MLNIAVRAARQAGNIIIRNVDRVDTLEVSLKGRQDYVTSVDRAAEAAIIQTIHKAYPEHAFEAEESGMSANAETSDYVWVIDPLDGTMNFLHGYPQFCVSIALKVKGVVEHGVVFDPMRNELFEASRGSGAQLDGRKIRVSKVSKLENALIATGFPVRQPDKLPAFMQTFERVLGQCAGIRRAGAAALDLAYVACGRLDGYWELGLQPWDVAAGGLLVEEAGGMFSCDDMKRGSPTGLSVMAAAPNLFDNLQRITNPSGR